jgi:threonine dehydrogenase-like Zn-dependent dehydrogenase
VSVDSRQRVLVLRARDEPISGVDRPTTRQRYRFPTLSVEDRTLGDLDADAVRVRMTYAAVCGTDVHLVTADPETGYVMSSTAANIDASGRVLGHEGIGVVAAAGTAVDHLGVGDVVAFASIVACGQCKPCLRGWPNQCLTSALIGTQLDGLFGTVVDVPATLAYSVTHAVKTDDDLRALACIEPAANAAVACTTAEVGPDDSVVVFGAGPLGLYCAMMARLVHGARRVVVVEPREARRRLAEPWCDATFGVDEFFATDDTVDVVIEASGAMSSVTRVLRRMEPSGRVTVLGRSGEPLVIDDVDHMISAAITIRGCRGHLGGAIEHVIRAYADGILPLGSIVTRVIDSLDELATELPEEGALAHDGKVLVKLAP